MLTNKYNVGDFVTIKKNAHKIPSINFNPLMRKYEGESHYIEKIVPFGYKLSEVKHVMPSGLEIEWVWHEDWLEPAEPEEDFEVTDSDLNSLLGE